MGFCSAVKFCGQFDLGAKLEVFDSGNWFY